jgi:hypothetical protein
MLKNICLSSIPKDPAREEWDTLGTRLIYTDDANRPYQTDFYGPGHNERARAFSFFLAATTAPLLYGHGLGCGPRKTINDELPTSLTPEQSAYIESNPDLHVKTKA